MSSYGVNTDDLLNVANLLKATAQQIDDVIRSTNSQVDGLIEQFHGSARSQFDAMFQQWIAANTQNAEAIIEYAQNVANASGHYAEANQIATDLLKPGQSY